MKKKLDLIITDENEVFLDGMERLLRKTGYVRNIYRAMSGKQALKLLASQKVDMLLTEIHLHEMTGARLIQAARSRQPYMFIVILTAFYDAHYIKPFLSNNVQGILDKGSVKKEFPKALKAIGKKQPHYSEPVRRIVKKLQSAHGHYAGVSAGPELSEKEKEYLPYIVSGLSNREIGKKVFRSAHTIDTHRINMYRKFTDACKEKVNNPAKLAAKARELGFID